MRCRECLRTLGINCFHREENRVEIVCERCKLEEVMILPNSKSR